MSTFSSRSSEIQNPFFVFLLSDFSKTTPFFRQVPAENPCYSGTSPHHRVQQLFPPAGLSPLQKAGNCPHCGQKWESRGRHCPRLFLLLRFRQLPAPLESGPNPARFPLEGYTVGWPLKAAHSGSQGATGATSASLGVPGSAPPDSLHCTPPDSGPSAPDSRCSSWGGAEPAPRR